MKDILATSPLQRVIINDKMADESPPPKKTGPLHDRVAIFEKQHSGSNTPSNPPPIRPKPGKNSWTQKPPSPPSSPSNKDKERDALAKSSMSTTDAQELIGLTIDRRVAGLDGKSGFGPEILNLEEQESRRRADVANRMYRAGGVRIWRGFGIGPKPSLRQHGVPKEETSPGTLCP